ncbi:MAG: lysophospholipid acyltransferase family protein [Alphaproteobacteria bacterium]|nr:lysophospholipid acyltransferase family protein [Alphaproteobacteria bacterium]
MIFIRSLTFNLLFFTISIIIGLFLFPFLISSSLTVKISHKWALVTIYLLKIICKIEIDINKNNLNKYFNNQVLFAVRHESVLETILFLAYFSNIKYIVKKELLYVPFYGLFVWRCGHIIIDRKERSKTIFFMLKKIKFLITKKENLVLFPHGTRVKYSAKVNIKPGIYAIYKHLKIPIIPVYMASGHVWDKKGFIKNPGIVKVTFFDSIQSGYSKEKFLKLLNSKLN